VIDGNWLGQPLPEASLRIEAGRLAFFAKAIGQRVDSEPRFAMPTFLFSAYADNSTYFELLDRMGVPRERLLHAEQSFEYLAPVQVGDRVRVQGRITGLWDKKQGALEFVEIEADAANQAGTAVARMKSLLVLRNPVS
jgi:hypothetical protein